ncbi:SPFH domain-containing protein [Olsenella sp. YH-ols2217]|uniref:SPFH domain-containing protein n=1 Tax=Kribbibacterium absianum TaxID=3044210 RepID=A0ABT6ZIN8_9ACTN|nr:MULTISPECIES: SPFH domain-containing protein [unclassified Olsenella]MDJ1121428.1 SPFH domain-containing protein [Olsenella sp. YH-ols2216]MDJ1128918.1 SPFH domain-containing protein [Olsenella sp. YH-ols2217]
MAIISTLSWVLVVLVVLVVIITGAYTVSQQSVAIIERFGKFARMEGPGFHVKIPMIETIAKIVDLRIQQDVFTLSAKTRDNVTIKVEVAVQYKVSEEQGATVQDSGVYRSYYSLTNPEEQMQSYIVDALRSTIPQFDLDSVFDEKDAIADDVRKKVSDHMIRYGFEVVGTLIQSIGLPKDVEAAMNDINAAERKKVAAQSLADAERIRTVTEAEAKADAMRQAGRGIAEQRKAIAEGIKDSLATIKEAGVTTAEANELFLYTQWTDMMESFSKSGKSSTVVLPADFRESTSMFEQMLCAHKADQPSE